MAIEVKHSVHIRKEDLAGLKSFAEDYPTAECFFLYKGKTIEKHGNIQCIPIELFLLDLKV